MTAYMLGYGSSHNTLLAQTMAFATLCTSRLVHGYNSKSNSPVIFTNRFFNNVYLAGAFLIGLVLITTVVMIPGLHDIFKVQTLQFSQLMMVYGLALLNLPVIQLLKAVTRKWLK